MKTENAREFSVSPKSLRAVVQLAGLAIHHQLCLSKHQSRYCARPVKRGVGGSLGNSLLRKQ